MGCYRKETIHYKYGLFDNMIDAVYVLTMEDSTRRNDYMYQLEMFKPCSKVHIMHKIRQNSTTISPHNIPKQNIPPPTPRWPAKSQYFPDYPVPQESQAYSQWGHHLRRHGPGQKYTRPALPSLIILLFAL